MMHSPFRARKRSDVLNGMRGHRVRHFHIGASGNTQKTTQNQNSSIDNTSQQRTAGIWNAAEGAAAAGPGALLTGASDYYTGLQKGGNLGFSALTGDAAAQKQLMNPFQQAVIDATNAQYDKSGQQVVNQTNDLANKAGAFGGSRHGVAEGVALSNNEMNRNATIAGLNNSGFDASMQRASAAANLGFNAAGQNANLGLSGVGSPDLWRLNILKQGYLGPQGQQSSGAQTTFGGKVDAGLGFGG